MKKIVVILISLFCLSSEFLVVRAQDISLPPLQDSKAYKLYSRQPDSELSRLLYLLNRFKEARDLQVVYDGHHYEMDDAIRQATSFLRRNYKKEPAAYWIKSYCHKTGSGNVILLKDPETNQTQPMLNAIQFELKALESVLTTKGSQ